MLSISDYLGIMCDAKLLAANAPKTSEYAFFKKLKKNAGCSHSYASQKEENQSKKFEPSGCSKGGFRSNRFGVVLYMSKSLWICSLLDFFFVLYKLSIGEQFILIPITSL